MQVRDQLEVLQSASSELMACSDFMILLRAVLTLGNHLNEGTMRGAASGGASCLAFGRCRPCLYTLMLQRGFLCNLTLAQAILPCRMMLGSHKKEGSV